MKDGQKKVHRYKELRIEANALMIIAIFCFLVDSSFFSSLDDEFSFHMYTHLQNERLSTNRRKERKKMLHLLCVLMCVYMFLPRRQIHQQFFSFGEEFDKSSLGGIMLGIYIERRKGKWKSMMQRCKMF